MSDDLPTTQKFLLDHLRRIVEGVSCFPSDGKEDGAKKTWIFGTGNDALISLEDEAKNDKRKSDAGEHLFWSSMSLDARDHMGIPKWLEIRRKMSSKDRQEFANALTEDGNWRIEEAYAFEMICKLKDVVDRVQKAVPEVHLLPKVPREVDNYLSEAVACFRYGFDLACISLCRCVLEEALKHRISESNGRDFVEAPGMDLTKLVDWAAGSISKVLDPRLQAKAHAIRVSGNDCVHGNLSEEQAKRTALRVLKSCRMIVQHLYNER